MNAIKKFFQAIFNFFGGGGSTGTGAEITIKLIALEVFKGKAALAIKIATIIAGILDAVNSSKVTTFAGVQALLDEQLVKITLAPEEQLAMGILMGKVKSQFETAMNDATFTKGADFTTAVQYLTWVADVAKTYSA